MMRRVFRAVFWALLGIGCGTAAGVLADTLTFVVPKPVIISDSGTPQVNLTSPAAPPIASIDSVTVTVDHEWLGDLTLQLVPPAGPAITLFDRPGFSATDTLGSSAVLGTFVPSSDPTDPSFDLIPQAYQFAATGADFIAAANLAITTSFSTVPTNQVYAGQAWVQGPFPAGTWHLLATDGADLSGGAIAAVQINYAVATNTSPTATLSWSAPADIVYGTSLGAAQLNAVVTAGGTPVPGQLTYSPPAGTVLNAGLGQTLSVTFIPQDTTTYHSLTASTLISVQPAPLVISADNKAMNYGGPLPSLTATYSGFVNGDTVASLTQPISLGTTATADSPNGAYPIAVNGGASPNYAITLRNGTLSVGKSVLTITAINQTKVYGAVLPNLTVTYSGLLNGDTPDSLGLNVTVQTAATPSSPPGTYPITVTASDSADYAVVVNNGVLTVTKAPLTVMPANTNKVYGAVVPALTATYSGFVNGDTAAALNPPVTLVTTATTNSPAGTYPITVSGGDSALYTIVPGTGTLTVLHATLKVAVDPKSKVYGAPLPTFTATYSGFVNGDTVALLGTSVSFSTTATAASPVGTYPIAFGGGSLSNYDLVPTSGTLTVTKATLNVTADDQTAVYGAALPTFTATYAGLINGDTIANLSQQVTLSTTAGTNSPCGTYPIQVSGGGSLNYTIVPHSGTLTVTKATLTVTANDQSKVYGGPLPRLTASYAGFVGTDSTNALSQPVSLTTTAAAASPTGQYPIQVAGGASANYTLVLRNGTLTVSKAPLLVSADNQTKAYGAALPTLTASYSGFLGGDGTGSLSQPIVLSTTAADRSLPGTYPITISGGASANYSLSLSNGVLTVSKALLTITADDLSRPYGGANPALTAHYDGFIGSDSTADLVVPVSIVTSASSSSPAGTYPISVFGGSSPKYSLLLRNGTLTVTKAALHVGADNKIAVYGGSLPALTASYVGFVNGDTEASLSLPVSLSTSAGSSSPAGSYSIYVSGGDSPNYTFTRVNGVLTIGKARLVVTAAAKSKVYGAVVPQLVASYSGFVNGDTVSSLTQPVSVSTAVTSASPAGAYPITLSGGNSANYTFAFKNGTLTVLPAALTIKANDQIKLLGAGLPPLTASYGGFVNGDTPASLTQPVTLATTATATSLPGSYPITASGAASSNYNIRFLSGTLTVSPSTAAPQLDATALNVDATGSLNLQVPVPPGTTVRLDGSSDLTTWQAIETQTASGSGVQFQAGRIGAARLGFYRIVLVPPAH